MVETESEKPNVFSENVPPSGEQSEEGNVCTAINVQVAFSNVLAVLFKKGNRGVQFVFIFARYSIIRVRAYHHEALNHTVEIVVLRYAIE